MSVATYVTYQLLNIEGSGMQPYYQVAQGGMEFDGGHFGVEGRYLGYLLGNPSRVKDTLKALRPWGVVELTESEAMQWAETSVPVNTLDINGRYLGAVSIDVGGRITRSSAGSPWSPPPRVVNSRKIAAVASFMEELPVLQDAIDYIDDIPDMFAAKVVLRKMCKAIYAIFYYTGMSED